MDASKDNFTLEDLSKCGIEVTADNEWDGYGLLKATHIHQLPTDTITYNFSHLTIQEFLCAVYISTLSQQEQLRLMSQRFGHHHTVFIFPCGLTGLMSSNMFQFVFSQLQKFDAVTAFRCLYDSWRTPPLTTPCTLDISDHIIKPYDYLSHTVMFSSITFGYVFL